MIIMKKTHTDARCEVQESPSNDEPDSSFVSTRKDRESALTLARHFRGVCGIIRVNERNGLSV